MGTKYVVAFMEGNVARESIYVKTLIPALWYLFFYRSEHEHTWKRLEVRD